jgi:hypothetical protein
MREVETREIDGEKYACRMMPATKGQKVLIRLTDLVGRPALVMAAGAMKGEDDNVQLHDIIDLGTRIIFERLTDEEADASIKDVLDGVMVENGGDVLKNFDEHFRGRILHMYKVFAWALEVNYRDFIDAALSSDLKEVVEEAGTKAWQAAISMMKSGDSAETTKEST